MTPLIILVLALYVYLSGLQGPVGTYSLKDRVQKSIESKVSSTKNMQNPFASSGSSSKLNLEGPFVCLYQEKASYAKVMIHKKSIYAKVNGELGNFITLISGDCMYKWQENAQNGTKICGMNQYYPIVETLTKLPFFSLDTIMGVLFKLDPSMRIDEGTLKKLVDSCKKQEVDEAFMSPPKTIEFVEQKLQKPSGIPAQ